MTVKATLRDASSGRWIRLADLEEVLCTHDPLQVADLLQHAAARAAAEQLHAVGFLSYEAASALNPKLTTQPPGWLPLCWFALFRGARAAPAPQPASASLTPLEWVPSIHPDAYRGQVERIRDYIRAGDTYQVNFSYRLRAQLSGEAADQPFSLFSDMLARQAEGYGAFIETDDWAICCASHELFFERHGSDLVSRPMKGTIRRGDNPAEDARLAAWLKASPKNRAENLMITDMVRNDLGRIAEIGSVSTEQLFRLEPYPTLWQMTSTVRARSQRPLPDVLRALFPAASITGAPKRRTMALIAELESDPRQIYTGTIGYLRPDGSAQFNVAIRTALVSRHAGTAEYGVGGGIVWDSNPAEEFQECQIKARIIQQPQTEFDLLETLLWTPEQGYALLDGHLARLCRAAEFFQRPADIRALQDELARFAETLPREPQRVRLLVNAAGKAQLSAAPLQPLPEPYTLALAGTPQSLADNPYVLHKTTRRDVYDAAREAAPGADDVLLRNLRGEVTESTIANLFLALDGHFVTPPVSAGLLPGLYRQRLLDEGRATERRLTPDDVRRADAVYLANSVRGLWRVTLSEPGPR